jgi:hypothetical protein
VPALPAGVAAEQRLGLKVGDSSFSWPLKQCDANAALEGSSRGRGLARCAVFPCVPREKMKNTKKSGWNTLARHAENIHRNSVSYHTWRNTRSLRYHHTIPPQKLKPCLFCRRARADVADVRKYLIPWYCGAQRQLSGLTVIIIGQEETTTTGDPSTATLLRGAKPQQSGKGEWKSKRQS